MPPKRIRILKQIRAEIDNHYLEMSWLSLIRVSLQVHFKRARTVSGTVSCLKNPDHQAWVGAVHSRMACGFVSCLQCIRSVLLGIPFGSSHKTTSQIVVS